VQNLSSDVLSSAFQNIKRGYLISSCVDLSFVLTKGLKLKVTGNKVVMKIFVPKEDEGIEKGRKLFNEELLQCLGYQSQIYSVLEM
jgi:hypothetical protein